MADGCRGWKFAGQFVALTFVLCLHFSHTADNGNFQRIVWSNNRFAIKMHSVLRQQKELRNRNIMWSPSSLSVALGMVYMGSKERTAEQIFKALQWQGLDQADVHLAFKTFHESIHSSEHDLVQLRMVNRIWGHHELEGTLEFSEGTQEFYKAGMAKADFVRRPEDARVEVNEWVERNTGGKILDLIPPGMFGVGTRLALVNAVYFKGNWLSEFDPEKTYHAPFYVLGERGHRIEVAMMSQKGRHNYFWDEEAQCQVLKLPYAGNDLSMIIALPDEKGGLEKVEDKLTIKKLQTWLGSFDNTTVEVALPKFKLSQQFELRKVLPQLGIQDLFREGIANLSGISTSEDLHVSHMVHKTHIEINEKGTEAAAASGVHVMRRSLDLHPVFHADHPFLFLIFHKPTAAILFLGRVVKPGALTQMEENKTDSNEEIMVGHTPDEL